MKSLPERLRERLITVWKPGSKPFKPVYPIIYTTSVGGNHKAGDPAGYMGFNPTVGACAAGYDSSACLMQEMIYAVDPLCEEAAKEIEKLQNVVNSSAWIP